MNKNEKEVLQNQLDSEKQTINELKQVYRQALNDVDNKISLLSARADMNPPELQSIIYQKQYQQAIKGQLEGIMADLQSNEYATISDYLTRCYHDGYVGTMYDIQGQGIPLIVPINQEQITKAIQIDTKLSKPLYDKLGEDVNKLKTSIRAEISRGIANGSTWNDVAAKISKSMVNTPFRKAYNNSLRIARTEGHRIQNQAALDAQYKAKEKGADIVKQWDATLDNNTRDNHRILDGQIKEVDEPFEVSGMKVDAPGMFGTPSEDCNCRCTLLQRARWALDEDELQTLKERAEFFGLDKSEDFEEYKRKYLGIEESDLKIILNQAATFVPATTIAEAEQYAKDNFVTEKTWSGNGNVSYKGLSVESANEINKSLTELYANYEMPKLENIQPMNFRANIWKGSENVPMAYRNMFDGELYFNPKILKNAITMNAYMEEGKKAFELCAENIDKFTGSNRELVERYVKAGRQLVAEDSENIISTLTVHEMGHHLQFNYFFRNDEAYNIMKEGFEEYGVKISGYATKDYSEYIAESFAAYKNGESNRIDPAMKNIFDSLKISKVETSESSGIIESVVFGSSNLKTVYLPKDEYAHVISEINTRLSDEERTKEIVSKAIGNYIYTFENYGFDNYRIIGKKPIDEVVGDIVDEKLERIKKDI